MTTPDRVFEGMLPYYRSSAHVFYITRGRRSWAECPPLSLQQWREVVAAHPELVLDEDYVQHNIDRGVDENWRECGRARWQDAPTEQAEHLHFSTEYIEYMHGAPFPGGPIFGKYTTLRERLGERFSLEDWQAVIEADRWLRPDQESDEPGRALWLGRRGQVKHYFRFRPPGVWLPHSPLPGFKPDGKQTAREALCQDLAATMDAQFWADAEGDTVIIT